MTQTASDGTTYLIDEAQDWSDAERDFLRALYGHRRLVLGDGQEQLIQRQQSCDWNAGVPAAERRRLPHGRLAADAPQRRDLREQLRPSHDASQTWNITPREELPGGRILIVTGDVETPAFARALVAAAAVNKADPVDCLVWSLPAVSKKTKSAASTPASASPRKKPACQVWDGTDSAIRGTAPDRTDRIRIVQYDSCRGLEGWITVALHLDELYLQRTKYPNLNPADPPIDAAVVAKRWLLIPLTRAVHTLIVTLRDPDSVVAGYLRSASQDPALPRGVAEWMTAEECIRRLSAAAAF